MVVRPFYHPEPPREITSFSTATLVMRRLYDMLQQFRKGKIECVVELTLTASVASTVLSDIRLSPQSVIHFDPKTANAAAEIANGTLYVTTANRTNGVFTITHANNAQADRHYQVSIIG